LVVGADKSALGLAERLRAQGILAQAIRPPTVPEGESRVRLILRGSWTEVQADRLVEIVARETRHEELNA
jgi:8-amino-7-oxononanoate synthase